MQVTGNRQVSWPGAIIALLTVAALGAAAIGPWLIAASALLALVVLWLLSPKPVSASSRVDAEQVTRDAVQEALEPLGHPLILVQHSRITLANAAARDVLGPHIVGQDIRVGLRHPDAVHLLNSSDGASVTIPGFLGGRTLWQLTRREIDGQRSLIELIDRTAEADVGRAHTDFVANASHELRTPLAAIIGYIETLSDPDQPVPTETAARFHEIVLAEARRMESLVTDLMSLSQVEAEKHDAPAEKVDLGKLVARVLGEVVALTGKDRVEFDGLSAADLFVRGEPGQLEQLVRNLIDNALKYGSSAEPVRVRVSADPSNAVSLIVEDKGPGIAPEHLPHLTRRFYRTDPGRSRAAGGTGLGLAIVKHIVERHRAKLEIESTLGEGTCVSVRFPPC